MRRGTNHEYMPEDVADDAYVLGLDFADDMPERFGPERFGWHVAALVNIHAATGVAVSDLFPADDTRDPDYSTLCGRLNFAGFDTYESDTTLEIYREPVTCSEDCAEECRPAGAWLGRLHVSADMLGPDDVNPHGIPRPLLRELDADTLAAIPCDGCGSRVLDWYACPGALKNNEPTCLDCCGCPEHAEMCDACGESLPANALTEHGDGTATCGPCSVIVKATGQVGAHDLESIDMARARRALDALGNPADWDDLGAVEYYVQEVREALAGPAPLEPAGPGRYVAEVLIGTVYRIELEASNLDEARSMLDELDPDDTAENAHAEEVDTARTVLEIQREA